MQSAFPTWPPVAHFQWEHAYLNLKSLIFSFWGGALFINILHERMSVFAVKLSQLRTAWLTAQAVTCTADNRLL